MVLLNCTIVNDWSLISVIIEDWKTVSLLRNAIAEELKRTEGQAAQLQLFLAKQDSAWLTTADVERGVVDTSVLTPLKDTQMPLSSVGLSENAVRIQLTDEDVAAEKFPLHVVVVDPTGFIGVDQNYADSIFSYMTIAERLKDSEEVQSLSKHLANVVVQGKEQQIPTPFVVLENSSGTGKTQMAFNLQARGECEVFYIVCGNPGGREQSVYNAYADRTRMFNNCVRTDLDVLLRGTLGNQLGSVGQFLGNTRLALYGFILSALRGSDYFFGEAQRSDVIDELDRREEAWCEALCFLSG